VVEAALRRKAAAVVFAHNHPNGDVRPSEHDKILTRALVLATQTVQIQVLDHLIVSPDAVFSFRKEGLL
jgi:DNA repair protein RadC